MQKSKVLIILSMTRRVVLIKQGNHQLIYKHAISTIVPEKDVDITFESPVEK